MRGAAGRERALTQSATSLTRSARCWALPWPAWVVLLVTAAVALAWGHVKLLSQDEIFVLQTDSVPSLSRLVEVQRTRPISLDPMVYHALAYAAMKVLGAFGLRLPSLLAYLGMQVGVFWFVRRWLGERAGVVAMAVPGVTATLLYAAEGRPYGLLLGLYAAVMVLWQAGGRRERGVSRRPDSFHRQRSQREESLPQGLKPPLVAGLKAKAEALAYLKAKANDSILTDESDSTSAFADGLDDRVKGWFCSVLVGLAVAIALALNTHYFGVLLLVPLWGAEAWRTVKRRRVDWPVVASIVAGMAGMVGTLPFQRAAGEFRVHYYNGGTVGLRTVSQAYRALFVDYTGLGMGWQRGLAASFVVVVVVFGVAVVMRLRSSGGAKAPSSLADMRPEAEASGYLGWDGEVHSAEVVFVLLLAGLPVFGFLLARFMTHSMEVRYVLGAVVGIAVLAGLVAGPWLRSEGVWRAVLVGLVVLIVGAGVVRVRAEQRKRAAVMASLIVPAEVKAAMAATPSGRMYFQDMGHFEVASYYEPDGWVRERMALVESSEEELRWDGHDTVSLTAEHMRGFTGFAIVPYAAWKQQPGEKVVVLFHSGWDWTDGAFREDGLRVRAVGAFAGGDAVVVGWGKQVHFGDDR